MEIKKRLSSILESPSNHIDEKLLKICQLLDQEYSYLIGLVFIFAMVIKKNWC
jgi:GAF domain-containing protein